MFPNCPARDDFRATGSLRYVAAPGTGALLQLFLDSVRLNLHNKAVRTCVIFNPTAKGNKARISGVAWTKSARPAR